MDRSRNVAGQTMAAWLCTAYGGVDGLVLADRPRPVPKDNEILVRTVATTVSSGDVRVRTLNFPPGLRLVGRLALGLARPRQPILGTELAGIVEAAGRDVSAWAPGDAIIAFPGAAMGCHAQYRTMAIARPIVRKPANLSFEDAASLSFGGMTALHFLRRAGLAAGEKVLVIGAGAVGSAMIQLARIKGARVSAVTSTRNIDLVRSLGAEAAIDYTREDFRTTGRRYDIIADTVAASTFQACGPALEEHGRYLAIAGGLADMVTRRDGTRRSLGGPASERPEDIRELATLAEAGLLKPVIDRVYPFEEMPSAHAYVETGRKRGSAVVTVATAG